MTTGRFPADEEYEKNEDVRTLVNAIAMLRASAASDYEFWSAFYKFAGDNKHRVFTSGRAGVLLKSEEELRKIRMDKANQKLGQAARIIGTEQGKSDYQEMMEAYMRIKNNLEK